MINLFMPLLCSKTRSRTQMTFLNCKNCLKWCEQYDIYFCIGVLDVCAYRGDAGCFLSFMMQRCLQMAETGPS